MIKYLTIKNLLIALLLVFSAFTWVDNKRVKKSNRDALNTMHKDSVMYSILEDKIISERKAAVLDRDQLHLVEGQLDDYKKQLGIEKTKNKNLRSVIEGQFKSEGEGSVSITVTTDTVFLPQSDSTATKQIVESKSFNINDNYLSLSGVFVSDSSLQYNYTYTDKILFSLYEKKQGLFKPKQTTVVAVMGNKNSVVNGINSVIVEQKPPLLNFSLFAGYGASSQGLGPIIGVGISKPIFTIK